ncbi:MAG TPA: glycosyltransferase [Chloroflexi bacterium]|jgi:biofilm PGA synthesis N-glycosyltransferase PgaC|nr:glycosyltransferase [Chloroflexota bacterium]
MDCAIAIMAYNEEMNIGRVLDALLSQDLETVHISQIVVVASGCTDRTEEIVLEYARQHPHICLIHQDRREGKAAAINLCKRHLMSHEIIVCHSADVIPTPRAIEHLVRPFEDPEMGMTGARPVPTNAPDTFMGYAAHLLWWLHHHLSLHRPKMGEVIAFRNVFRQIPRDSAVDEASIEPLIIGQGLNLRYVPEAVVYNHGPETLHDMIKQRRRIYAGHLYVKDKMGYAVSTMKLTRIVPLFLRQIIRRNKESADAVHPDIPLWRHLMWGPAVGALEAWCRILGIWDYTIWKQKPFIWAVADTTKDPASAGKAGV